MVVIVSSASFTGSVTLSSTVSTVCHQCLPSIILHTTLTLCLLATMFTILIRVITHWSLVTMLLVSMGHCSEQVSDQEVVTRTWWSETALLMTSITMLMMIITTTLLMSMVGLRGEIHMTILFLVDDVPNDNHHHEGSSYQYQSPENHHFNQNNVVGAGLHNSNLNRGPHSKDLIKHSRPGPGVNRPVRYCYSLSL